MAKSHPIDFRENTSQDVITKLEPELLRIFTWLTVQDFHLLVTLRVFYGLCVTVAARAT